MTRIKHATARRRSIFATLGMALPLVAALLGAGAAPATGAVSSPLHLYIGYADGLRGSSPDFHRRGAATRM